MSRLSKLSAFLLSALCPLAVAAQDSETRALNELRNTVVNLLQGLVDRGVLSRDQAEQMVSDAQRKAAAEADALAAQARAEESAVRVPYVPQIVREEIRREVSDGLVGEVSRQVVEKARNEGWGVPAALPDWIRSSHWYADVRVRGQGDYFADGNTTQLFDIQNINEAGGIGLAGPDAFLNTTEDRERMRMRMRLGVEADLGAGFTLGARIASGNLVDPVSTNQTLGNWGGRYQVGIDLAYLAWNGDSPTGRHDLSVTGGRMSNPWLATSDLVWDTDLAFDGFAARYRLGFSSTAPKERHAFATIAALPLQEVELADDKWLLGGQLGLDWSFGGGNRLRIGTGYFDFRNVTGRRNDFESTLLDYTAPRYVGGGNTVFDIRNDNDPNTNLFALATRYRVANAGLVFDWRVSPAWVLSISGDYARNAGYDAAQVLANTGQSLRARDKGYQGQIAFGSAVPDRDRSWRAFFGYRYLEADAVLDAFTESDFRLGGTNVQGFLAGFDYALSRRVVGRLRYLSGNEIDGLPYGVDVVQFDITGSF